MSTNSVRSLFFATALTVANLALLGCNQTPLGTHKIGVILPMTGILSEMGQYEKEGMNLALQKEEKSGGDSLNLIFEDGKGENKSVAAATSKLLDIDGVQMLITSTTGASLTARPLVEAKNLPLLAFCMGSDIAPPSKSTIRYYIGIREEAGAIMGDLQREPGSTRVGVLHASVAVWTTAMEELYKPFFKGHFEKPVQIEQYDLSNRDFRPQLTRLKQAGVKRLLILGYGFEYEPLFRQMGELGMRDGTDIIGGFGFLYTSLPANQLEGVRVAGPMYVFKRGAAGSEFEKAYQSKYSHKPNFDAAFAYEVIHRLPELLAILKASGIFGFKQGLVQKGTFDGVMGSYHFAPSGDMIVDTAVGIYRSGVIVGE